MGPMYFFTAWAFIKTALKGVLYALRILASRQGQTLPRGLKGILKSIRTRMMVWSTIINGKATPLIAIFNPGCWSKGNNSES